MNKAFLYSSLLFLLFAFIVPQKVNIRLIGDSTMAAKKPERDPESVPLLRAVVKPYHAQCLILIQKS